MIGIADKAKFQTSINDDLEANNSEYVDALGEEAADKRHGPRGACEGCNMTSFVLLIALSTHAVFEGIALGLTPDLPATINIMLALGLHKSAASMSLGISISRNFADDASERLRGFVLLLLFAFATPWGISLGLLL